MNRTGNHRHVAASAPVVLALGLTLFGCGRHASSAGHAAQAAPADTAVTPAQMPPPRPEYGSNAATDAISERSRAAEARPQPESAPESSGVTGSAPESRDDNSQASPSTGDDASAQDSAAHHPVVPRKSRRPGGH